MIFRSTGITLVSPRLEFHVVHFFNPLLFKRFFCETRFLPKHYRQFYNPLFFKEIFHSQYFSLSLASFFYSHLLRFTPIYVKLKKNKNIFLNLKITRVSQSRQKILFMAPVIYPYFIYTGALQ